MTLGSRVLFEVKAYVVYFAALLSVFVTQIITALCLPIPTPGGAPGWFHAFNLMLWSIPGIIPMRWILGLIHGTCPAWSRVFAGYVLCGALVFALVSIAELWPAARPVMLGGGIMLCLTLGYAFTRVFVLEDVRDD